MVKLIPVWNETYVTYVRRHQVKLETEIWQILTGTVKTRLIAGLLLSCRKWGSSNPEALSEF